MVKKKEPVAAEPRDIVVASYDKNVNAAMRDGLAPAEACLLDGDGLQFVFAHWEVWAARASLALLDFPPSGDILGTVLKLPPDALAVIVLPDYSDARDKTPRASFSTMAATLTAMFQGSPRKYLVEKRTAFVFCRTARTEPERKRFAGVGLCCQTILDVDYNDGPMHITVKKSKAPPRGRVREFTIH